MELKNSKGNTKQSNNEYDSRHERKAVVIADTFTNLLSPIKDDNIEGVVFIC